MVEQAGICIIFQLTLTKCLSKPKARLYYLNRTDKPINFNLVFTSELLHVLQINKQISEFVGTKCAK